MAMPSRIQLIVRCRSNMFYIFLALVFAIIHNSLAEQVQTEQTIVEEWSWQDNGNGGFDRYHYYSGIDNDDDLDGDEDTSDYEYEEDGGLTAAGLDQDEETCEQSCPRYYRPVCVLRNGRNVTFATLCEFHNEVRCAHDLRRQGHGYTVPIFQYQHDGVC
ncbi:uncharacterized protein LOC6526253 [Drosophila yakuba]|uniref:Kazal-like domain-containing protein n=1 Tax=Drosophila yakuba TaxID=7245 RepID=B4P1V1_DROYA|nr:uncharacterized protein LOC6526253 [Drosophila yakuba]EDW87087.2 uncharacterized protein Dyak_GE16471 [Drosophila yakuba]